MISYSFKCNKKLWNLFKETIDSGSIDNALLEMIKQRVEGLA